MNRLLQAAAALVCAAGLSAFASTSNVTATLTDSDGTAWANCAWSAVVSSPTPPTISGVPVPDAQLRANGSCNGSGTLSATMLDTSSVDQRGVTWTFTITPNASVQPSVVSGVAVSGASVNLSTNLSSGIKAPRFNPGPKAYGYADAEVNAPTLGDTYFNTAGVCGSASLRQYSNAGWQCGGAGTATAALLPSGASADYKFLDATGTTVTDSSGNGNDATFCSSVCTAPTWTFGGLQFSNISGANKLAGLSLPATLNSTQTFLFVAYQEPIQKGLPPVNIPVLLTSSGGSASGFSILSAPTSPMGTNFENTGYSVGTFTNGSATDAAANRYTGLHAIAVVCGAGGGTVDHLYIDGVEVSYSRTQGTTCGAQTTGNFYIGNSGVGVWATSSALVGTMYRAVFWPTKLSASDIYNASMSALEEVHDRGVNPNYIAMPGLPTLFAIGDSITFGAGVTTAWPSLLSLTNQPAWNIQNYGISSVPAKAVVTSEPNRIAPQCQNATQYQSAALVFLGTNDFVTINAATYQTPLLVWQSLASEIGVLKHAGCRVFVATMLSRSGNGTNGQTNDVNKNGLDALIASGWQIAGADGILDFAANPLFGADGAYANTTYFQADGIHPTQTGQNLLGTIASNSLNYYYSQYGPGNPHYISATATLTAPDSFVEISSPSATVELTLPTCVGPTGSTRTIVNPQSAQTVTVVGASASEPINGLTTPITIPGNTTVTLTDVANPRNTAGCHWTM